MSGHFQTTDYLRARYYLYAETTSYTKNTNSDPSNYNYNKWQIIGGDVSTIWTEETVSDALKADPRFFALLGKSSPLFCARAGDSRIVVYYAYPYSYIAEPQRATVGHHWYYDPVLKVISRLGSTVAYDCNLGDWGFGKGIFDR